MSDTTRVRTKYDLFSRLLHWLTAGIIIYAMCMGYVLHLLAGTSWFHFFSELNMSLATVATPVMMVRFVWRFFKPAVPYPDYIPPRKRQLVAFLHEMLYLTIMVVLISGFLMLKNGYCLFGLIAVPQPVSSAEINAFFFTVHRTSCMLLGLIVVGHIGAVINYRRKGQREILQRMM
ncbi:cytochrome B [Pantoea agglomerans]|nr:cytochrome b/b6 domain-containing protein [Pantoea agglomerans]PEI02234.1 cytochrome B [Pantoea agglomerans]